MEAKYELLEIFDCFCKLYACVYLHDLSLWLLYFVAGKEGSVK